MKKDAFLPNLVNDKGVTGVQRVSLYKIDQDPSVGYNLSQEKEKRTIVRIPKRIISLAFMRRESVNTTTISADHFAKLFASSKLGSKIGWIRIMMVKSVI